MGCAGGTVAPVAVKDRRVPLQLGAYETRVLVVR